MYDQPCECSTPLTIYGVNAAKVAVSCCGIDPVRGQITTRLRMDSSARNLNLCLAAVDLGGGGVYSITMELLNHHDGMVIPS